jgi:ABC-type transport system involved in cytochrome bd biosynthesis fused ATPase/permease subunit
VLLVAVGFLFVIPSVLIVRIIFDHALPQSNFHLLFLARLGVMALNLVTGEAHPCSGRRIALKTAKPVINQVRADLLVKMYTISRRYFSETESSLVHSRIVHDSDRVDIMTNSILSELLPAAVCSIAVSLVLLRLN